MLDVYLTIDTECSMGGAWDSPASEPVGPDRAILGRRGPRCYGTPLIMDLLEEHDLRATFFVEVFASTVVDGAALGGAYREIVERGHDAQLHLHPVFRYYAKRKRELLRAEPPPADMDQIGSHPPFVQLEFLQEGVAIFEHLVGRKPVAFRAGNYSANHATLAALEQVGIRYDSSFNAAYLGHSCLLTGVEPTNSPWRVGSVWEVPLTVFTTGVGPLAGLKPLEIGAVSFLEIKRVLEQAEGLGMGCVNMILHSFSLLKKSNSQFSRIRPDHLLIRRVKRVCRFLAAHRDRFRVVTFSDLPEPRADPPGTSLPRMGLLVPATRRFIQGLNRLYWP
jgi:peptidoglycan/xylan/chitin deacetylase (PgdA/CDA1 family)